MGNKNTTKTNMKGILNNASPEKQIIMTQRTARNPHRAT